MKKLSIWKWAGLDQMTYAKLPYEKKKVLINDFNRIFIQPEQPYVDPDKQVYKFKEGTITGPLWVAFFRGNAEAFTLKENGIKS